MSSRMPKPTRETPSPSADIHVDVISEDDETYVSKGNPLQKLYFSTVNRNAAKRRDSSNDDISNPPHAKRWAVDDDEAIEDEKSPPETYAFTPRPRGIFLPKTEAALYTAAAINRMVPSVPDDDDDSDFDMPEGKRYQDDMDYGDNSSDDDDEEDMDDDSQSNLGSEAYLEDEVEVVEVRTTRHGGDAMLIEHDLISHAYPKRDEYPEDCSNNVACGEIIFKLKGVRNFRRCPENTHFYSRYLYVRGIPYRIMVLPRDTTVQSKHVTSGPVPGRHIGYFVQCYPDLKFKWTMRGHITLKMMSKRPGKDDYVRRIVHSFHPSENDWGYAQYYNCDQFDEPHNGFIVDDTIEFRVTIMVDPPKFNLWSYPTLNQKYGEHLGIKNLGSTCYFNSMMQMIFGVKKLRKLVYSYDSTGNTDVDAFMFELQSMFFRMQYSDHPVDSLKLGQMLWTDPYSQEDVHEMFIKVVDRVSDAFKAKNDDSINQLFRSRVHRIVKCLNVPFEKILSADENICILLCVRMGNITFNSVKKSMENFVSGSRLEGDNCYNTERFGLQAADMFSRFATVPPVLVLTLQRSTFDAAFAVKLNDRFEYAAKLCMEEFLEDSCKNITKCSYILYSVVVHYGESGCGHYACYVNTNFKGNPRWVKCDDELTFRVTDVEAISNNFGVPEGSKDQDTGTAYVVTYIREDQIDDLMCDVTDADLHPNIRQKIYDNFEEDYEMHFERMDTIHSTTLMIVDDQILKEMGSERFDIINYKQDNDELPRITIPKDIFLADIYTEIRKRCDMLSNVEFRVYLFRTAEIMYPGAQTRGIFKGGQRPCVLVPHEGFYQSPTLCDAYVNNAVYVRRHVKNVWAPEMYHTSREILVFVKYYENGRYKIAGSIMVENMQAIVELKPEVRQICNLEPDCNIRMYTEVSPNDIRELEDDDVATSHNGFDGDGSIIVCVKIDENYTHLNSFPTFWESLSRGVTLIIEKDEELYKLNSVKGDFQLYTSECFIDTAVPQIVDEMIAAYPNIKRSQVFIWKQSPVFEKPSISYFEHMNLTTVADILSIRAEMYDPREEYKFNLRYTVFPFEIKHAQNYFQHPVHIVDANIKQAETLINQEWTIGELLEYCQQGIVFNTKGTGKLRLVAAYRVGQEKAYAGAMSRAFRVLENEFTCEIVLKFFMEGNCSLRIEQTPEDQLTLAKNEALIPVVHFESDLSVVFGFSFFLKIRDNQPFAELKSHLKAMMNVTDEIFLTLKFFLYEGVQRVLTIDDTTIISLSKWQNNDSVFIEQPVLAIQHKPSPDQIKIPIFL